LGRKTHLDRFGRVFRVLHKPPTSPNRLVGVGIQKHDVGVVYRSLWAIDEAGVDGWLVAAGGARRAESVRAVAVHCCSLPRCGG